MTLTEEEATTKWCPFGRAIDNDGATLAATCNRGPREEHWTFCIGSACMAWRPGSGVEIEQKIDAIRRRRQETGDGLAQAKLYVDEHPEYIKRESVDAGFCGLAGRPS